MEMCSPSDIETNAEELPQFKRALLLGMVYSKESTPSRGQGYRDMVRCQALEKMGYLVETVDDKHDEELGKEGRHCRANFSDLRKMLKNMKSIWDLDQPRYDTIILDYFFSPTGWANTRWGKKFFIETIPAFIEKKLLKRNGRLWIPNNSHVGNMVVTYSSRLSEIYEWREIKEPIKNPLYAATETVREDLLRCPDHLTNDNQIVSLTTKNRAPFLEFTPIK